MHLCLTVECIASGLQFLQHCFSIDLINLIRSHPPFRPPLPPFSHIPAPPPPDPTGKGVGGATPSLGSRS